jgi:predicted nucleotidyltransferase
MEILSPLEMKAVRKFKEKLQKAFGAKIVVLKLFGSRAKGRGDEFSDLDVAVIVTDWDWQMKRQIFDLAWECYWEDDVDISPLVLSQKEYDELKSLERNIARDIERYGVTL